MAVRMSQVSPEQETKVPDLVFLNLSSPFLNLSSPFFRQFCMLLTSPRSTNSHHMGINSPQTLLLVCSTMPDDVQVSQLFCSDYRHQRMAENELQTKVERFDQNRSQKFNVCQVKWKSALRKIDRPSKNSQDPKLPPDRQRQASKLGKWRLSGSMAFWRRGGH